MKSSLLLLLIGYSMILPAQESVKLYPSHWWTGFKSKKLQLLIQAKDLAGSTNTATTNYAGVSITKVNRFSNPDYLALDLNIAAGTRPGVCKITVKSGGRSRTINYLLKAKSNEDGRTRIKGVSAADFIYLIMPDRFSNGDPSNDKISGYRDQSLDRSDYFKRHGGDLKGVENKLDYLDDLGVTAVWLNPIIENDMPDRTEHGYAFTDHYQVDKRLGGNEAYHRLADAIHNKGMKLIQDAVYNHVGIEHHLYRNLPDSNWFHWWPQYTNTTYKDQVLMDPYASSADKKQMSNGWFTGSMPDLNQKNEFVANFLIQHAIWTTEEYGIDGWRIDTYAYNDLDFMNRCNKALLDEFPKIHLFGETWVHGVPNQAFFAANKFSIPYKSNLPGVTDFQLNLYGIVPALTQSFGWTEGLNRMYLTASNDFVYANPMNNVIFLDNHDISRFFSIVGEDVAKMKAGLAWLLTYRGIPQLYYGTEILMKNFANPDGLVRLDFPGGWAGDGSDKFGAAGRTAAENEVFTYTRNLARFRRTSSAIKSGKMMQYVPEDNVYVYFRYDQQQTVMCVFNAGDGEKEILTGRFSERIGAFTKGKDVVSGVEVQLGRLKVKGKELMVLELR